MAEGLERKNQYAYNASSNLVLQADRRRGARGLPSSEVTSLSSLSRAEIVKEMGSRVDRAKPPVSAASASSRTIGGNGDESKKRRGREEDEYETEIRDSRGSSNHGRSSTKRLTSGPTSVLSAELDVSYVPLTETTRAAYDQLLMLIEREIGHKPRDVLRSAADEVIDILKDDTLTIKERRRGVEELLSRGKPMESERFSSLYNVSQRLTDYGVKGAASSSSASTSTSGAMEGVDGVMQEDANVDIVPVLFDEEEEEKVNGGRRIDNDDEGEDIGASDVDEDVEGGGGRRRRRGDDSDADVDVGDSNGFGDQGTDGDMLSSSHSADSAAMSLNPRNVDAFWLQRQIATWEHDPVQAQKLAEELLSVLSSSSDAREIENKLVVALDYNRFGFIKLLLKNRLVVVYCTRLARARGEEERARIEKEMESDIELMDILRALKTGASSISATTGGLEKPSGKGASTSSSSAMDGPVGGSGADGNAFWRRPRHTVDINALTFEAGSHTMSNKECKLPEKSEVLNLKGYQEIHIPAAKSKPYDDDERHVLISDLPSWAQLAFPKMEKLNRVQSKIYKTALLSPENMLVCAPTGAGKTNCAMLTVMHTIGLYRVDDDAATNDDRVEGACGLDLDAFKIVYIAPMKSLVQEMVLNFSNRLAPYGITVRELSGDSQLTKAELARTQVIVTTPEKWDIVTRKEGDRSVTQNVKLIIIDEVHLLHDSRGPVLESIVARTLRHVESMQEHIRLVGLSATLPNYEDVATFLRVNLDRGLHYFDSSYRPCPLHQQFIGITGKKAFKRMELINDITYEKVLDHAGKNQVLVFVHSRKDTVATAKMLRDMAVDKDDIGKFLQESTGRQELLKTEAGNVSHQALKDVLPYTFAFHHAGMTREDRTLVEELFADGHIQVLVSTATLAWGVNLPAHAVIIKGTQVYSPEQSRWVELSPQDVTQMMGRAGRPQFDQYGEGILITTHKELQFYLSLLNEQLPVESQFMSRLADSLNAEIVAGSVQTLHDAVDWLGYTYLYVRMLQRPDLYGVSVDAFEADPELVQYRLDLAHSAASVLEKHGLVQYDRKGGNLSATELGRVASYYYITYQSMSVYNENLKPSLTDIELFRVFSLSSEFKYMSVREEEKLEIASLMDRVPVPIKGSIEDPVCKVNVLLQAYLSRLSLEGLALVSDMVFITQSAGRIARALFEILIRRGWAQAAIRALTLAKMIDRRMWAAQTPLRQFPSLPTALLQKIENKDLTWDRLLDLDPYSVGEYIRQPKLGKKVHSFIHQVPKLELKGYVQPITTSVLRVTLTLTPDFQWLEEKNSAPTESFWIIVEDVDGERAMHWENFTIKRQFAHDDHTVSFTVPVLNPLPPQYFIRVVSDRWIGSDAVLPISFRHLILPARFPPLTELLDLQPLPVSEIGEPRFVEHFSRSFTVFNPIQTQTFNAIFKKDDSVMVAAPTGSGKTVLAELAIMRHLLKNDGTKVVYLAPMEALVRERYLDWQTSFGTKGWGLAVRMLTGESAVDVQLLNEADIALATPEQWDIMTRRWRTRKAVQAVRLVIADELHLLGGQMGPPLEVALTRVRYIGAQLGVKIRIVGLSTSISNTRDVGDWIGAPSNNIFAFPPSARPVPLDIGIVGFDAQAFESRQLAMTKPLFQAIAREAPSSKVLVYAPTRKHCRRTADELIAMGIAHAADIKAERVRRGLPPNPTKINSSNSSSSSSSRMDETDGNGAADDDDDAAPVFLHVDVADIAPHLKFVTPALAELLSMGVGIFHEGLTVREREVVKRLFAAGALQIVVAEYSLCWETGNAFNSSLVVLLDSQVYDGNEHRYMDLPIANVIQMMGRTNPASALSSTSTSTSTSSKQSKAKCLLYCHTPRRDYYRKFLFEPFPVESHLDQVLHDYFNAEVINKRIEVIPDGVDYLTWTFFYRRLRQNANYYNMSGTTTTHVSDHLSELVENTLNDLATSQCISIDGESLAPLNLGRVADYYTLRYTTVELFASTLSKTAGFAELLDTICAATELEIITVRQREDVALEKLSHHLKYAIPAANFNESSTKCNVLLQAHFSGIPLTAAVMSDQHIMLPIVSRLLYAIVDVVSSSRWFVPVLAAIQMSQMVTMGVWSSDPQLMQVPHIDAKLAEKCAKAGIKTVADLLEMDDVDRNKLLALPASKMSDVARFCNAYPDIELQYEVEDSDDIAAGSPATIKVLLTRAPEEDEEDFEEGVTTVVAVKYPKVKQESWWLVLGAPGSNELWGIKRITLKAKQTPVEFAFVPPKEGNHSLRLFLMSDSWIGADQEHGVKFKVLPPRADEEGEDEE